MTHTTRSAALAVLIAAGIAQAGAVELKTDAQKIGYTIGADMGQSVSQIAQGGDVDLDALISGLKQAYEGKELAMSPEDMDKTMKAFAEQRMKTMQEKMQKLAAENAKKGEAFLKENKSKDGVKTTDSGLQYKVLQAGDGAKPSKDDSVTVNYEGRLLDGKVFDSSYKRGEPVTFKLSDVIPGWVEGLQLMKKGAKYTFYIPAKLAYGEQGAGPAIGPNETLIFDVELLGINDKGDQAKADDTQKTDDSQAADTQSKDDSSK